ncbi:MAG: YihY/virulence factor BrkB family protein [Oscillospiraceae bacterium]|nr:YihY/virulence factor BrkB family protein [Oscillospiraceae bacterium]
MPVKLKKIRDKILEITDIILGKHVFGSAAEMAYYLMLSIFPALILIYSLLMRLNISWASLVGVLERFIPENVVGTVRSFGEYVDHNFSKTMTVASWVVIVTSASGVVRSVFNIMGDIQGKSRFNGFFGILASVIVAVLFVAVIYLSIIIIATGGWFLRFLNSTFGIDYLWWWRWIRFVILFLLLYFVVLSFYLLTTPKEKVRILRYPGALTASAALVGVSILFSLFISASTRYALIYGSLASVIIMMVWLFLCSMIIICGNILNLELNIQKPVKPSRRARKRSQPPANRK